MRLIDADAIQYTYTVARDNEDGHHWHVPVAGKDEIDDMPTIDAVPVVRCGECIHHKPIYYCAEHKQTGWFGDMFCSDGKRREEEHNAAD